MYDDNVKEAEAVEQAYAAHLLAAKELHQAQMQMMRSKRAIRTLNDEFVQATTAAVKATELVDRKRKATAAAEEDFNATSRMTRHCYGTAEAADYHRSNKAPSPNSPVYHAVSPVYSKVIDDAAKRIEAADTEETQLPVGSGAMVIEIEQESQDP